jgi:hypothetical protein
MNNNLSPFNDNCQYVSSRTGKLCNKKCLNKYCSQHKVIINKRAGKQHTCNICGKLTMTKTPMCSAHRKEYLGALRQINSISVS